MYKCIQSQIIFSKEGYAQLGGIALSNSRETIFSIFSQSYVTDMLNIIRMRKHIATSVESLRDALSVSRSTADKVYNLLSGKESSISLIYKDGQKTLIRNDTAYFLGISIGTKYVRVALLGLGLEPVELESVYSREQVKADFSATQMTADEQSVLDMPKYVDDPKEKNPFSYAIELPQKGNKKLETIRTTVRTIILPFLEKAENDGQFPLMGIGFSVTGPVDYDRKIWRNAPRINDLQDITIADLVGYGIKKRIDDMGICLSIDNNAKAAAVSEYDRLVQITNGQYHEDLSVIYIGSGMGLASIVDRKLFRGGGNLSELGQVELMIGTDPIELNTIEELIWGKDSDEPFSGADMDRLKKYLPYVLKMVSCLVGTSRFILVGHNITTNDDLVNEIMDQRNKFTVKSINASLQAETSRMVPYTSAIGAAMEVYYTMCNYDPELNPQNKTNLAKEISWNLT